LGFRKLWGCRKKNVGVQEEEASLFSYPCFILEGLLVSETLPHISSSELDFLFLYLFFSAWLFLSFLLSSFRFWFLFADYSWRFWFCCKFALWSHHDHTFFLLPCTMNDEVNKNKVEIVIKRKNKRM